MLTRPFLVVLTAMAMATLGIGMGTPILPIYARELGASGTAVGLTFSSFALVQLVVGPFAGSIADRYGRKPFLVAGLLTYTVTAIGWLLTEDVLSTILFRGLSGAGAAFIFTLAATYIGDLAPAGQEGRYMGWFGVATFVGLGIGPVVAGVIRDLADIPAVFASMAVMFTATALLVTLLLPAHAAASGEGDAPLAPPAPWSEVLRNRYAQALFIVRTAFAISMGASLSFIAVYLEEELLATTTMVGVMLAGQQLTGGVLQPPMGVLADRTSRRRLVVLGSVLVAAGYSTVFFSESYWVILAGFVLGPGIGGALINVTGQAIQVDIGRELGMATSMSLQTMSFSLGVLVGSLGGGVVLEAFDLRTVFLVGALAMLGGAALFLMRTVVDPAAAHAATEVAGRDEQAAG